MNKLVFGICGLDAAAYCGLGNVCDGRCVAVGAAIAHKTYSSFDALFTFVGRHGCLGGTQWEQVVDKGIRRVAAQFGLSRV